MAKVFAAPKKVTGLVASGVTDGSGTWNTVDLTAAGLDVPADAVGAVVMLHNTTGNNRWMGARNPGDVNSSQNFQRDMETDSAQTVLIPINSGDVAFYVEEAGEGLDVWLIGYMEANSIQWLSSLNEVTQQSTASGAYNFDWSADAPPGATGAIFGRNPDMGFAMSASPTSYSNRVDENTGFIVPFGDTDTTHVETNFAGTQDFTVTGWIMQPITAVYDDNGGPSFSGDTAGAWVAGTYDYGSAEGLGCIIGAADYIAHASATNPFDDVVDRVTPKSHCMHSVAADGTWSYQLQGSGALQHAWFMGEFTAADITAPVLSNEDSSVSGSSVTPAIDTNEDNGTLHARLYAAGSAPTGPQIIAGTGGTVIASQNIAVSAVGPQTFGSFTSTPDADYVLAYAHEDAAGNVSAPVLVGVVVDTTAPVLSNPTAAGPGADSFTPQVTTDEAGGVAYARLYSDGDAPTGPQVISGTGGGTIVASAASVNASVAGIINFAALTGIAPGNYELAFAHVDLSGNQSTASIVPVTVTGTQASPIISQAAAPIAISDVTATFRMTGTYGEAFEVRYVAVARDATPPTEAAIDAGSSNPLSSNIPGDFAVSGLAAAQTYDVYYQLVDTTTPANRSPIGMVPVVTADSGGGAIDAATRFHVLYTGALP